MCVLRTFSKAYGLAALRVGYAIAHESVIGALRKVRVPFEVNGLAQVAASASLRAHDEMAMTRMMVNFFSAPFLERR